MKAAGLQQMAAMATLMRENFFTASISALVPGVGLMLAAGGARRSMLELLSWWSHTLRPGGRLGRRVMAPGCSETSLEERPPLRRPPRHLEVLA